MGHFTQQVLKEIYFSFTGSLFHKNSNDKIIHQQISSLSADNLTKLTMAVTWQKYVEYMKNRGNISEVLILGKDGAQWATSSTDFYLRQYKAMIMQEDGTEKEELVNEAANIVKYMKGQTSSQGIRMNGQKKQQITRNFLGEETGLPVIITKIPNGGGCIANAGKCILIGTFDELQQHQSSECNETIMKIAMYLKKSIWPEGLFEGDDAGGNGSGGSSGGTASWQEHVDKALVASKHVSEALIFRLETNEVLAKFPATFDLQTYEADIAQEDGTDKRETVDEGKNLKIMMTQKMKPSQGLRLNQTKFQIVRQLEDENSSCYTVYGKKPMGGAVISIAGPVIIVAVFDEKQMHTSPGCAEAVGQLAKYLKEQLK